MIFEFNKDVANKKLSEMFSEVSKENYSMYDTMYIEKFQVNSQEIFQEHYRNLKPCLDQIKNFDPTSLKSSSDASNIADLKFKAANKFFTADYDNLVANLNDRLTFLAEILPDFDTLFFMKEYSTVLNKIQFLDEKCVLQEISNLFKDDNKDSFLVYYFERTKNFGEYILTHPDVNYFIDTFFRYTNTLSIKQLEILGYVCTYYEAFALASFIPLLYYCLGAEVFVKFFIPIHYEGAFTKLMNEVISKQLEIKDDDEKRYFR